MSAIFTAFNIALRRQHHHHLRLDTRPPGNDHLLTVADDPATTLSAANMPHRTESPSEKRHIVTPTRFTTYGTFQLKSSAEPEVPDSYDPTLGKRVREALQTVKGLTILSMNISTHLSEGRDGQEVLQGVAALKQQADSTLWKIKGLRRENEILSGKLEVVERNARKKEGFRRMRTMVVSDADALRKAEQTVKLLREENRTLLRKLVDPTIPRRGAWRQEQPRGGSP